MLSKWKPSPPASIAYILEFHFMGLNTQFFCLRFMIFCQHKEQKMLHVIAFMMVNWLGGQFSLEFGQRKQLKLCFMPY